MRVIYNGIDLFAVETHEFYAEPVYDDSGVDYLYTRFSIHVTAVVNGQVRVKNVVSPTSGDPGLVMSYNYNEDISLPGPFSIRSESKPVGDILPGLEDGIDVGVRRSPPRNVVITPVQTPVTHATVRHRLTTPRGFLYVFSGLGMELGVPVAGSSVAPTASVSEMILESPSPNALCDAKNGPTPRLLGVTAMVGDAATMIVEFSIETYVNEAEQNNARPFGALVSNRWKQSHAINKDGYTTVNTEGIAIFRTDLVYADKSSPDVDRPNLLMPIPQGFTREIDYVSTREDVSGIEYGYRDTQVPVNFVAGPFIGAGEITAVHRQGVTANVDFLGGAYALAERGTGMLLNAKWLRGERTTPPGRGPAGPVRPGGPGAGRLMVPGGRAGAPGRPAF